MKEQNEIQDELKRLSSSLHGLDKKQVGDVPEGYFSSLEDAIISRIEKAPVEKEEKPAQVEKAPVKVVKLEWKQWAVAASVALVLGLTWMMLPKGQEEEVCNTLACLEPEAIEQYLDDNIDSYEDVLLEEVELDDLYETDAVEDLYLDELDEAILIEEL